MKSVFIVNHACTIILNIWIAFTLYITLHSGLIDCQEDAEWPKPVLYSGPSFVYEDNDVRITCRMSRFDSPKWTLNDQLIRETDRISMDYQLEQLIRIESISISRVSLRDSGIYRCNSYSRASHRLNVIPLLKKYDQPEPRVLFVDIKQENETLALICPNIDQTTKNITWYREGNKIESGKKGMEIVKNKLIIEIANRTYAGQYMCRSDQIEGSGGVLFGQIIQLRAAIKIEPRFPSKLNVVSGTQFRIECHYTGYPHGKVKWLLGNEYLDLDKRENLGIKLKENDSSHPDSVLIIESVNRAQHQNMITCVVTNTFSEDESNIALIVRDNYIITNENCWLDGCGGVILPFSSPKLTPKSLTVWCNISDGYEDTIRNWYKDGVLVTSNLQNYVVSFKDDLNRSSSLVIRESTPGDIGDYMCDTIHGRTATIKVRLRPLLEQFNEYSKNNYKSANIVEGDKFSLDCKVRDDFTRDVNVTWYRFDDKALTDSYINSTDSNLKEIIPGDHIKIEGNLTIKTLTIDKILPSDRAYYVCRAYNGVTVANNTILLRVKDKLGALWPFLGIVAEVIILCTIIFIYEKRRIKPDFDESDDDPTTEAKTTPQDRVDKADVRQRK